MAARSRVGEGAWRRVLLRDLLHVASADLHGGSPRASPALFALAGLVAGATDRAVGLGVRLVIEERAP
jgi:hypothetical protein